MTQDEIIEMAMQVGGTVMAVYSPDLIAFAALVAAKEREACAKVADYYASGLDRNYSEIIADAIRARGEQA